MAREKSTCEGALDHATDVFEVGEGGIATNEVVLNDKKPGRMSSLANELRSWSILARV